MPLIKLYGNLRTITNATKIEVEGCTVKELIKNLENTYPQLTGEIIKNNEVRPHIRILFTGKDIELRQGLETPLGKDDQLAIFPAIAGG